MPAPSSMPNLAAWFVAGVGITSAGGLVSQWADQSGNGRHLKQATGTNQPALQADGTILFDGVDNFLKCDPFTLNQPTTIYGFLRQVTWTASDFIWSGNDDASLNRNDLFQDTTTPQLSIYSGAIAAANTALAVNTYGAIAAVYNGATSVLQINGTTTTGNAGAQNAAGFILGALNTTANFSNIQVKEVAIFSVAHDAPTRAGVIAYLNGSEAQAAARNIGGGPRPGYRFTPYIPRRFAPRKKTRH